MRPDLVLKPQVWLDASHDFRAHSLAGYLASVENWERFCDEWQAVLDMSEPPHEPIKVFKMQEMRLDYQPHFTRCELFYRTIEKYVEASITVSVSTDILKKELAAFKFPSGYRRLHELNNAYFWCFYGLINLYLHDEAKELLSKPTDLLLDDQQEASRILAAWEANLASIENAAKFKGFTFSKPTFRDDEHFKPLQAADMFAFWCRKWESENRLQEGLGRLDFPWPVKRKMPRLVYQLDAGSIRRSLHGAFGAL